MQEDVSRPVAAAEEDCDPTARRHLFASLYSELHNIARREVRRMGFAGVGVTTLLHEAYLDLEQRRGLSFPDRARFLAYASRVMRGLVIGHARSRQTLKRGFGCEIGALPDALADHSPDSADLQRLSDAIEELTAMEPRLAQVVDLKYFGGFSFADIAAICQTSERTVQRDWEKARLLLHRSLATDWPTDRATDRAVP